jgi:hypothetical protein
MEQLNQNHGFHAVRNASITFYHWQYGFDTSSSQPLCSHVAVDRPSFSQANRHFPGTKHDASAYPPIASSKLLTQTCPLELITGRSVFDTKQPE